MNESFFPLASWMGDMWKRGGVWRLFGCENGNQDLILRQTGKSKPSHHSSSHLPSRLSPTAILYSIAVSPWGQAHHVTSCTTVPESRVVPAAPLLETYISKQRAPSSHSTRQITHVPPQWPPWFYVSHSFNLPKQLVCNDRAGLWETHVRYLQNDICNS